VSLHFLVKLSIAYCAKCTKSPSICWDTATLKYQKIDKISKYRFYIVQNILVLRILVCLFRQWMLLDTMSWVPFWCRRVMKWLTQNSSLKLPIRRTASLCTSKMHQNDAFWKRYRITRFWIVRLNRVGVRIMAQSHRNVRWLDTRAGDRLNGQCCIVSVVCSLGCLLIIGMTHASPTKYVYMKYGTRTGTLLLVDCEQERSGMGTVGNTVLEWVCKQVYSFMNATFHNREYSAASCTTGSLNYLFDEQRSRAGKDGRTGCSWRQITKWIMPSTQSSVYIINGYDSLKNTESNGGSPIVPNGTKRGH